MKRCSAGLCAIVMLMAPVLDAAPAPRESHAPQCTVSTDPTYAYTRENPVRIGGGAFTVAARERRYMDALRGPDGQELTYKRRGSGPGPDETILDIYEVSYEGLEEPLTMYLDAYRWAEPQVPRGLTCGRPFNLPVPGPDPFGAAEDPPASARRGAAPAGRFDPRSLTEAEVALNELAAVYAFDDRTLAPIPLDPDRPELGVALSTFHRKVLVARAQVAAGGVPDLPIEMGPRRAPRARQHRHCLPDLVRRACCTAPRDRLHRYDASGANR